MHKHDLPECGTAMLVTNLMTIFSDLQIPSKSEVASPVHIFLPINSCASTVETSAFQLYLDTFFGRLFFSCNNLLLTMTAV